MLYRTLLPFLLLLALGSLAACGQHNNAQSDTSITDTAIKVKQPLPDTSAKSAVASVQPFDTVMNLFADTSCKVSVHIEELDPADEYDDKKMNASLTICKSSARGKEIQHTDSLHCMQPWLRFDDYNNDGVKDLLIFNTESARSNETYYLYIVSKPANKLQRIKGFEKIWNPSVDDQNIITSLNLTGTNYYSFYNITAENKLINLGHSFDADLDDTVKFDKAMQQILKEKKGTVKANAN